MRVRRNCALHATFCVVLTTITPSIVWARTFKIGVLLPQSDDWNEWTNATETITFAVDKINTSPTLAALRAGGHNFTFYQRDTLCDSGVALSQFVALVKTDKVEAVIGPGCDDECVTTGRLASQWDVPMFSYSCGADMLSNKERYPTFLRTAPSYAQVSPLLLKALAYYHWKTLVIIRSHEQTWAMASHEIGYDIAEAGYTVHEKTIGFMWEMIRHTHEVLMDTIGSTKAIFICANRTETGIILREAVNLGMFNGDYVFISMNMITDSLVRTLDEGQDLNIYQGLLDITTHFPDHIKALHEVNQ